MATIDKMFTCESRDFQKEGREFCIDIIRNTEEAVWGPDNPSPDTYSFQMYWIHDGWKNILYMKSE